MSHLNSGLISAYNSLTDRYLAGYFSNTRIRRHLQRAGLITSSGRIVPDKEYRQALIQRAHQRRVRECLAQAIFHKVLEMERAHQIEIKRKLEEFARRQRVHKIKVERPRRYEEDMIRILSPRPPAGAKSTPKHHPESSESPGSSRPNTAPEKMQRPVRLKPIRSSSTAAPLRRVSPWRLLEASNENDRPLNCTMDKASRRRLTTAEVSHGVSPYRLPVINNFVTPVPPATRRKDRGAKVTASFTLRGRRLRLTTASSGPEDPPVLRSSVHQSKVCVHMIFFGKTVHLSHDLTDLTDLRDEIKVFQQHCGGENLCVFKGKLQEGETFQFISRRHRGFPFSLTFFLNGLQVERLSSCCEFKHRKGPRLGGRHGHFGFCSVEGASPCYKCIIAVGLDKKPTPPPKRVKEGNQDREASASSLGDAPRMEAAAHPETRAGEAAATGGEDKAREYEEDFEADDEGTVGDVEENESPSPSGETGRRADEGDASGTEDNGRDEDTKCNSASGSSDSDREESDAEAAKDSGEDERAEEPSEVDGEEIVVPPGEAEDGPKGDEATALKDSGGDTTGKEVNGTGAPAGSGTEQSDDAASGEEDKREEQERAKSVQEKLAEAILKESLCSSEPELSDTSTEEEEVSTHKGPEKDSKDAFAVNSVTLAEQQPALEEEEGGVGENKLLKDPDETSEAKDHENKTDQEPQESSDGTRDEKLERKKAENPAENPKQQHTEHTALHPISEEAISEDHEAPEPPEEAATSTGGEAAENNEDNEDNGAEPENVEEDIKIEETDDATGETMEMKAKSSEEREALNYEEAPVTGAEDSRRGDSEDGDAASETGVTAGNSSSSFEWSGDAAVDKAADANEDDAKDESTGDAFKEGEASAAEDVKDVNKQRGDDLGEEQTGKSSVGICDELEEKREGEEKQTKPVEKKESENVEESEREDEGETEEESNESKTKERIGNQENISEWAKSDSNAEGNADEEQAEGDHGEEEETAEESEKTERDEGGENKKDEEDSEEKGAATDETNECEKMNADGEKEEKAQNKDAEESQEKKVVTDEPAEGEEISEISEESEKNADLDEDNVKTSDGNVAGSEDASDREAAQGTETAEEVPNNAKEAEDVVKETEGGSDGSEKKQLDVENGEMSARAENSGGEAQTDDPNTTVRAEDGRRTQEPTAVPVEAGDAPEERKGDGVCNDVVRSEAEEEKDGVEKRDEPEESEESKENGHTSATGNRIRDSYLIMVASAADQVQSSPDTAVHPNDTPHELDESTAPSVAVTDGHPPPDGDDDAAADLPDADGENAADAEEASKASEEGASVLLKPQARLAQGNEEKEESEAAGCGAPEALAREDNADLVTNWVTVHQTSKCFETFVEPLEDLEGSSPLAMERAPGSAEREPASEGVNETGDKSEGDTVVSNVESDHSEDGEPREAKDSIPKTGSEPSATSKSASRQDVRSEEHGGGGASVEVKVQEGVTQDTCERTDASQSEVESIAGSRRSVTSGGPEGVRTKEMTGDDGPEEPTTAGGAKDPLPSSETGERLEERAAPEGPSGARATGPTGSERSRGKSDERSREVTEITDFLSPKSDDGSRDGGRREGGGSPSPDAGTAEDKRDSQLIQDIGHALSKDPPSTSSVDETMFGQSSRPLLTESGH